MSERSKFAAMLTNRCPACHEGPLFESGNPYSRDFMKMYPKCPNCGENFQREPGFYFGAAYVSYALTVALWVACIVALYTFDAIGLITYGMFENPLTTILVGVGAIIVLLPVLFRLSRSLWIHIFVKKNEQGSQPDSE